MVKPHAHIVSHTEKRTRLRVVSAHRNAATMEKFAAAFRRLPRVDQVRVNARTGSILLDHSGGTQDQFKGVFEDIGYILSSTLMPDLPLGKGKLDLPQAIVDLDARLGLTNSPLSFKNLMPLSLGTLAFIQMRRQGVKFAGTPWYILAYLAYYTYTRLNNS